MARRLVGLVSDVMTQARLEAALAPADWRCDWLAAPLPDPSDLPLGEPTLGAAGAVMDTLTRPLPHLILLDLGDPGIPWRGWIARLTSVPATRRVPLLAFGPHVAPADLAAARQLGAAAAWPRSRLFKDPHAAVEGVARPEAPDLDPAVCAAPLSAHARTGLRLFAAGEYFEAHEYLEWAWNEDPTPARELYRGILQAAVAYLHVTRGNWHGAIKMLLRARSWFEPFPAECRGVAVGELRDTLEVLLAALQVGGPEGIAAVPPELLRPARWWIGEETEN
jgi:predicted metal-dependent hydrolase